MNLGKSVSDHDVAIAEIQVIIKPFRVSVENYLSGLLTHPNPFTPDELEASRRIVTYGLDAASTSDLTKVKMGIKRDLVNENVDLDKKTALVMWISVIDGVLDQRALHSSNDALSFKRWWWPWSL